jgi:hypothetical protein
MLPAILPEFVDYPQPLHALEGHLRTTLGSVIEMPCDKVPRRAHRMNAPLRERKS